MFTPSLQSAQVTGKDPAHYAEISLEGDQAAKLRQLVNTDPTQAAMPPSTRKPDRAEAFTSAQQSPSRLSDQASRLRALLDRSRMSEVHP